MSAAQRAEIRSYVKSMRTRARQLKVAAAELASPTWRETYARERRHAVRDAWHWRGLERTLRRIEEADEQTYGEAAE